MAYRFVNVDGKLCVQMDTMPMSDGPFFFRHTYPTGINTFDFLRNFGESGTQDLSIFRVQSGHRYEGGIYSFYIRNNEHRYELQLIDGGKTLPIKTEKIDIPCPKVKKGINTRWSSWNYQWEKELKTGWCRA